MPLLSLLNTTERGNIAESMLALPSHVGDGHARKEIEHKLICALRFFLC